MPRPKGSKNKKKAAVVSVDYAAQISEKQTAKAEVVQQIESQNEELAALKAELKVLKAQAKSLDKEIGKLQEDQAAQEAAEAEAAKRAELESVLKKLEYYSAAEPPVVCGCSHNQASVYWLLILSWGKVFPQVCCRSCHDPVARKVFFPQAF